MKSITLYSNKKIDTIYEACTCCYNITKQVTFEEKKDYIKRRIKAGHTSILEHGFLCICILDVTPLHFLENAKMSDGFKYLYVKCVDNGMGDMNILISGSIRAFRHFFITCGKKIWMQNSTMYKIIAKRAIASADKIFFEDLKEYLPEDIVFVEEKEMGDSNKPRLARNNIVYIDTPNNKYLNNIYKYITDNEFNYEDFINSIPVTVMFENVSRTATHQIVRHRNAITQESQRYVDYSNAKVTIPEMPYIDNDKIFTINIFGQYMEITKDKLESFSKELCSIYKQFVEQGMRKEDARAFLPSNVQCKKLYMTFTIRTLKDFIRLRTAKGAQQEIRKCALELFDYYADNFIIF